MLSPFKIAFNLSEPILTIFRNTMNERYLSKLIRDGNFEGLQENEDEIAKYVTHIMETADEQECVEDGYLTFAIGAYSDCTVGLRMFETFRWACRHKSPYHWHEIMAIMGHSLMCGAVLSRNIKILEHVMCHVDENELYKKIVEENEVSRWYDEKFS